MCLPAPLLTLGRRARGLLKNNMSNKRFKWTVEFEVDETWVADGFDMTSERAHLMIQKDLAYAYPSETSAKVILCPFPNEILAAQGYTREQIVEELKKRAEA